MSLFEDLFDIADGASHVVSPYTREQQRQARVSTQGENDISRIPEWDSTWRKREDPGEASRGELMARVQKLELTVEALFWLLSERTGLTKDELALAIQRVDLVDGVEDGAMGPDRTRDAPSCPKCRRPRNPSREACLYCGNTDPAIVPRHVAQAQAAAAEPPPRLTACGGCGNEVPERDTYFTGDGLRCSACYSP